MKYTMSMFRNKEELKNAVMCDNEMTDMEKLQNIFAASKEELKKNNPQLYYAILAILNQV